MYITLFACNSVLNFLPFYSCVCSISLSENYIFGKFDAFCKRLEKVNDMLTTIDNLSKLPDVRIEVGYYDTIWYI